jgi:hypothetical protein
MRDDLYKQLDKVDFWISNADTKASFILAFSGVLTGLLVNDKFVEQKGNLIKDLASLTDASIILFILNLFTLTSTIFFSLLVLSAKTKGEKKTYFFWGDVSQFTHWSYFNRVKQRETQDALEEDMLYQIYINSKICTKKFNRYRLSLKLLMASSTLYILFKISIYCS